MSYTLPKNTPYTLSPAQRTFVQVIAAERHAHSRRNNVVNNRKAENCSDTFVDEQGLSGEVVMLCLLLQYAIIDEEKFMQSLEAMRSMTLQSAAFGTDKGDITIAHNMILDVKTTHHDDGTLVVAPNKLNNVIHGYALITGQGDEFCFRGWKHRDEIKNVPPTEFCGSKVHRVWQKDLNAWEPSQTELFPTLPLSQHPLIADARTWDPTGDYSIGFLYNHGFMDAQEAYGIDFCDVEEDPVDAQDDDVDGVARIHEEVSKWLPLFREK